MEEKDNKLEKRDKQILTVAKLIRDALRSAGISTPELEKLEQEIFEE